MACMEYLEEELDDWLADQLQACLARHPASDLDLHPWRWPETRRPLRATSYAGMNAHPLAAWGGHASNRAALVCMHTDGKSGLSQLRRQARTVRKTVLMCCACLDRRSCAASHRGTARTTTCCSTAPARSSCTRTRPCFAASSSTCRTMAGRCVAPQQQGLIAVLIVFCRCHASEADQP